MRCTRLIAPGAFHTGEQLREAGRRAVEQCIRRLTGGVVWSWGLRGLEVIRELDQGPRRWVLEVLGCRGGFAIRQGGGGFYICLDRGAGAVGNASRERGVASREI